MAEFWDILDHTPPHHIAFTECCFVDPDATGVGDVIFDCGRADGFASLHDACGDGDPAAVADGGDDFALGIYIAHELEYSLVTPQFIGCPAAWDNKAMQFIRPGSLVNAHIRC